MQVMQEVGGNKKHGKSENKTTEGKSYDKNEEM